MSETDRLDILEPDYVISEDMWTEAEKAIVVRAEALIETGILEHVKEASELLCSLIDGKKIKVVEGFIEKQKYVEAVQLLQILIDRDQPFPDALNLMGMLYENSWGVEKNDEMALSFYQQAHDLGVRDATFNLACAYLYGSVAEKDLLKAIELFTNCAERGDPEANLLLGEIYDPKLNSDKSIANRKKAMEHYTDAALSGYCNAQYNLASLLHEDGNQQEAAYFAAKALLNLKATPEKKTEAAELLGVILKDDVDANGGKSKLAIAFAQSIMAQAEGWFSVQQPSVGKKPTPRDDANGLVL